MELNWKQENELRSASDAPKSLSIFRGRDNQRTNGQLVDLVNKVAKEMEISERISLSMAPSFDRTGFPDEAYVRPHGKGELRSGGYLFPYQLQQIKEMIKLRYKIAVRTRRRNCLSWSQMENWIDAAKNAANQIP